jgi:hypothetical protein
MASDCSGGASFRASVVRRSVNAELNRAVQEPSWVAVQKLMSSALRRSVPLDTEVSAAV